MKYADKLKDPRWQRKRLEVFERDNFTCRACGDDFNTLNVHHLHYYAGCEPWDYGLGDLITLCENCHKFETETRRSLEQDLIQTIKACGWLAVDINELAESILYFRVKPPVTLPEPKGGQ
jgi:5-methylcytosine-specific restriction endonuclease McrA